MADPSYLAKIRRAKEHLGDLQAEIDQYAAGHPYAVRTRIEGKKHRKTFRLQFTSDPASTNIPILAADAIYNLRSSLDHLMGALVARKDRGSAMFPIFFKGVWEEAAPGEDEQRLKERGRWASYVKTVKPEAVAILKTMQPPDDFGKEEEASMLRVVNGWSNRDRHEKLPVVTPGLLDGRLQWLTPSGQRLENRFEADFESIISPNAEIAILPRDAMDVQIEGTPAIAISVGGPERSLPIPKVLAYTADLIENDMIPRLAPYVRM